MILAADIGNSDIVLGIFKDSELLQNWRLHTVHHQSVDEYEMLVRGMLFACDFSLEDVDGAVLSSVVPELTNVFLNLIENLNLNLRLRIPIKIFLIAIKIRLRFFWRGVRLTFQRLRKS